MHTTTHVVYINMKYKQHDYVLYGDDDLCMWFHTYTDLKRWLRNTIINLEGYKNIVICNAKLNVTAFHKNY